MGGKPWFRLSKHLFQIVDLVYNPKEPLARFFILKPESRDQGGPFHLPIIKYNEEILLVLRNNKIYSPKECMEKK